jgi:hypothetical protein
MRRQEIETKCKKMEKKKGLSPEDPDCPGRDLFLFNNWCVEHMKVLAILAMIG